MTVRVCPGARREGFEGVVDAGGGKTALKIALRAKPEGGRANKELLAFLASAWDVPKSSLSVAAGESSRLKTVLAQGSGPELLARVEAWAASCG